MGISPDGVYIAETQSKGDGSSEIVVWELSSGDEVQRLSGTEGKMHSAAFSPDGTFIVTGEESPAVIRIWDVDSGEQVKQFEVEDLDMVWYLSYNPDGRSIYGVTSFDWRVWDVETGAELKSDDYFGTVQGLSHSPSGELASFTNFTSSRWFLWDKEHWSPIQPFDNTIEGHYTTATSISPDENSVIVAHTDGTVRQWDLTRQGVVREWTNEDLPAYGLDISPDGSQLVSGHEDSQVVIWDLETGQKLKTITGLPAPAYDVDFSPDGAYIGIVSADFGMGTGKNGLVIWDLENEVEHLQLDTSPHLFEPDPDSTGNYYVYRIKFSPDGKTILTGSILATGCCDEAGSLVLWDAQTGEMIHLLEEKVGDYLTLDYTSDSQKVIALEGIPEQG